MQASIKLGRIFGIEIGLHYSWLLIALLIAFSLAGHFGAQHPDWEPSVIWGMALVTAVFFFAAIVAHELSHALSSAATSLLEKLGFTQLYNIVGGTTAWINARFATTQPQQDTACNRP